MIDERLMKKILVFQKNEAEEYRIYYKLSEMEKNIENSRVLRKIAEDERRHELFWEEITGKSVHPFKLKVFFYTFIARVLGLTFGIKLMEKGEENAQISYKDLSEQLPKVMAIYEDEEEHEHELIGMLDEDKLKYAGSIVLGLNDALVELTGSLAGLTFALQNTRLIALVGLITGIAASMSMAASEYISTKTEESEQSPLKSSIYTGIAYIATVFLLILPYLLSFHYIVCLAVSLITAVVIIFLFNYYISIARDLNFKHRFFEMTLLSLSVAGISFGIGILIRMFFGVDL